MDPQRVRNALGKGGGRSPRSGRCCAGPEREGEDVDCGSSVPPGVSTERGRGTAGLVLQLWGQRRQTSRGEEDCSEQGGCETRNGDEAG